MKFTKEKFYRMISLVQPVRLREVVEDVAIGNARDTTQLPRDPDDEDQEFWGVAFGTAQEVIDDPAAYLT